MNGLSAAPTVFLRDNTALTNSMDVALYFEKLHAHVLRDIRNLIKALEGDHQLNFELMVPPTGQDHGSKIGSMVRPTAREVVIGDGGKRLDPCYDLTRDGFTLLAMGFTGPKALQFKLRYIEAFNAMEATLKAGAPSGARVNPAADRHALDLMDRLKRETNPAIRRSVHDMLTAACQKIGIATPPLDAIGQDAPPPPDLLGPFWSAIAALEAQGAAINHAADPALIALNLPELAACAAAGRLAIPVDAALRRAPGTVRCWVFRRTSGA